MNDGKKVVATAVNGLSKSIGSILDALRDWGEGLTDEEFGKIFPHIKRVVAQVESQATRERMTNQVATFSFDIELPKPVWRGSNPCSEIALPANVGGVSPLPTPAVVDEEAELAALAEIESGMFSGGGSVAEPPPAPKPWKQPVGRVARSSPNTELAGKAVHVEMKTAVLPDNMEGIDLE